MGDSRDTSQVPRITLAGSFAAMGEAHGEALRGSISELAELRIAYLLRILTQTSAEQLELIATAMMHEIERQLPNVFEETAATARAADIPYWKLVVAGAMSDVADVAARRTGSPSVQNECTLIAVATRAAGVVLAGTWDTHATATEHLVICERQPDAAPATLSLTTAGWPLQHAVTAEGLGLADANLVGTRTGTGVPFIAAMPEIARAHTLADAGATLERIRHASGRYYLIGDAGGARGSEVVPRVGVFSDDHVPMAHTNHYLFNSASSYEGRENESDSSKSRLVLASGLLGGSRDVMPTELVTAIAKSGICQDGVGDDDRTGAIFALLPRNRSIHFATSCDGDITELKFRLES